MSLSTAPAPVHFMQVEQILITWYIYMCLSLIFFVHVCASKTIQVQGKSLAPSQVALWRILI